MRKVDLGTGWVLVAFGTVHVLMTRKLDPNVGMNGIWFASGGLLMITIGALNLLRVAYASVAKGVRTVSVIANVVLVALMLLIATRAPMRSNPQIAVGLVLAVLLTVFSVLRRGDRLMRTRP